MFKVPKYTKFLDPMDIPAGYGMSLLPPVGISDTDFRTALTEAYQLFSDAIDQETAARMRRGRRHGMRGWKEPKSGAELKAARLIERRRSEIILLLGGLVGSGLDWHNKECLRGARELCILAEKRAQGTHPEPRSQRDSQIARDGFRVPFSPRNAPKRRL